MSTSTNTENKIFYGLSKVYIVPITAMTGDVPTYGAPFALPGAVSWGESAEGENTPFRADNIDYYVSVGNNGYSGDLEVARVNDTFAKFIYGMVEGTNGELIEVELGEAKPFALIMQIEGDKSACRHVYPYCTAGRSSADHSTTEEGAIEPGTETIPITAKPVKATGFTKNIVKYRVPSTASDYDSMLTTFALPTLAISA